MLSLVQNGVLKENCYWHKVALFLNPKFKSLAALCNTEWEQVFAFTKRLLQIFKIPARVQRSDHMHPHLQKLHNKLALMMSSMSGRTFPVPEVMNMKWTHIKA